MTKKIVIFSLLVTIGIALLVAGLIIASQWEIKEEYGWQEVNGEMRPITTSVTVYPLFQAGLVITLIGGILETIAAFGQILLNITEEQVTAHSKQETAEQEDH
jgi:hypothetical protein